MSEICAVFFGDESTVTFLHATDESKWHWWLVSHKAAWSILTVTERKHKKSKGSERITPTQGHYTSPLWSSRIFYLLDVNSSVEWASKYSIKFRYLVRFSLSDRKVLADESETDTNTQDWTGASQTDRTIPDIWPRLHLTPLSSAGGRRGGKPICCTFSYSTSQESRL